MPRCLRSGSRRQKLQVQHIQQVNKTLRVNINQCIAANIDNFNQVEFLSLFGLTQVGMKNGQKPKRGDRMKRTPAQHTDDDIASTMGNAYHTTQLLTHVLIHGYNEAFKHLECEVKNGQHIHKALLEKKRALLHDMRDAVADQRKCDLLFEEEKRMNFILKISINELLSKMLFLCETKKSVPE